MDDVPMFEQQLGNGLDQLAGPPRPVDAMAISRRVIATTQSPRWRFQTMFSALKFVVAGAIVALSGGFLLAGVLTQQSSEEPAPAAGASASASPQDTEAMASSVFAVRLTSPRYGTRTDPDTGLTTVPRMDLVAVPKAEWDAALNDVLGRRFRPDAADPRALGVVTEVWATDEGGPVRGGVAFVQRRSTRVENDGGAWVGRATIPGVGVGVWVGTAFWELTGEGGYEGLTMFLFGDFVGDHPELLLGMIVPSDNVPEFPPPPSDAPGE